MQAASITYLQLASNTVEPSAEAAASSKALRINAGLPSQTTNTLFAAILQEGIEGDVPLNVALALEEASPLLTGTDSESNTSETASVDVCGLLMQLLVMNSSVQTEGVSATAEGETTQGIVGITSEQLGTTDTIPKGLLPSATAVLSTLTTSKNTPAGSDRQPTGEQAAALASIAEALNNERQQTPLTSEAQSVEATATTATVSTVSGMTYDKAPNAVVLLGKNDTSDTVASSDEAKTTDRADGLFRVGATASAEGTAESLAAGAVKTGDQEERNFTGSSDNGKNNALGTVGDGTNPVFSGAVVQDEITAEKTSAVQRALNSFADDITSFSGSSKEITIILEPESLGVLTISVLKTEGGISAKIKSEDKEIAAIISGQLQKLIISMESRGLTVDNVDVAYNQMEQNTSFNQQNFSQARDNTARRDAAPSNQNTDANTSSTDFWQSFQDGATSDDTALDYRI